MAGWQLLTWKYFTIQWWPAEQIKGDLMPDPILTLFIYVAASLCLETDNPSIRVCLPGGDYGSITLSVILWIPGDPVVLGCIAHQARPWE